MPVSESGYPFKSALEHLCDQGLLPLSQKQLTLECEALGDENSFSGFKQLLDKVDYRADEKKVKLSDLNNYDGIILIALNQQRLAYLIANENNTLCYHVIGEPESVTLSLQEASAQFQGRVIHLSPKVKVEARADIASGASKSWFWNVILQYKKYYIPVLIAAVLINVFALVSPFFVMNVYDRVLPNAAFASLWALAIGVSIAYLFDLILKIARTALLDGIGKQVDVSLSQKIYQHILWLQMKFKPASSGSFANNLRDFESLRSFFSSATIAAVIDLPFVILFLVVMFVFIGITALVPLILGLLMMLVVFVAAKKQSRLIDAHMKSSSQKHAIAVESIAQMETIKTLGAEQQWLKRWATNTEQCAQHQEQLSKSNANVNHALQWLSMMNVVVIVIVGVYLSAQGLISMGGIIASVMLAGRVLGNISRLGLLVMRYEHAKLALTSLDGIMHRPIENTLGQDKLHLEHVKGAVVFDHVDFSYQIMGAIPGATDTKIPVARDLVVNIKPKEKIAIIGRMGSGKTTLLKLLMGLYQPDSGMVRLDGVDVTQIDPVVLRQQIAYSPQDCGIFYGSLKDNILMGKTGVADERLLQAIKMAGCMPLVTSHPQGLSMQIQEAGKNLSNGQRRAIALARMFCSDASIVVLDEPLTAMDVGSEKLIMQNLKEFCDDKTLIMTTHKSNVLQLVDRIIWVDAGRIVADGPRDEVLKKLGGGHG